MKNGLKFFLCCLVFVVSSLCAMESQQIVLGNVVEGDDLVWDLVFTHYLEPQELSTRALLDTTHRKHIVATTPQRKELLSTLFDKENNGERQKVGMTWHKFGIEGCRASVNVATQELILESCVLQQARIVDHKIQVFQNFIDRLPYKPAPFRNNEGVWCFYGYGKKYISHIVQTMYSIHDLSKTIETIFRYSLDGLCLRCRMLSEDNLVYLLEYPVLEKAILNSKIITKAKDYGIEEEYLEFDLNGVTIPKLYQVRMPCKYIPKALSTENFEQLPVQLKLQILIPLL